MQPVQPVPPHCPYLATAQAPPVGSAVDRVVGTLVVEGVEAGALVTPVPMVPVAAAPEHGDPADFVEPPLYTVGPGSIYVLML